MAKRKAKALGEVTITRTESDDTARAIGVAGWRFEAGLVRAYVQRSLRGTRYYISASRQDERAENTLYVGPSAVVMTRDFAVVVAKAKQLMARAAR